MGVLRTVGRPAGPIGARRAGARAIATRGTRTDAPRTRDGAVVRALPATLGVAVVTHDDLLVERVAVALEREGVVARVEVGGRLELEPSRLTRRPDVVLLAGVDPRAFARQAHRIRRRLRDVHVVLVVGAAARSNARHVLDAGVEGVVLETELEATLAIAVRAVCAGHLSLPRAMRHGVEPPAFSHRERQILRLVVAGLTNEQIARRLYLAKSTVAGHLTLIFRTLGVRSRAEVVALVLTGDDALRRSVLGTELEPADVVGA